jgi:hypothetical protein
MSRPTPLSQVEHIVWHPVESVMPENKRDVLIKAVGPHDNVWTGFYLEGDGWYWGTGSFVEQEPDIKVTHWAELPEGPKQ